MSGIRKIARSGVSDQVYAQLKENVLDGTWQPGEKIPSENELVSLFGVSRASIRMAIQRMATLGLLESRVGDGTYVKEFTPGGYINEVVSLAMKPEDQIEVMEFRKALEAEALRLAVKRATDDDLAQLEEHYMRARAAFKALDSDAYFKEDMLFHVKIFQMSKNSIFVATVQSLGDVLFPHFYSVAKDFFRNREVPSDEVDPHTSILIGLKNRDIDLCLRAHARLIEDLIVMYKELQLVDDYAASE
jgi:GntR family transcriptional repressor for pyruvate dehydrogenase complex